jgi:hypothetical protein
VIVTMGRDGRGVADARILNTGTRPRILINWQSFVAEARGYGRAEGNAAAGGVAGEHSRRHPRKAVPPVEEMPKDVREMASAPPGAATEGGRPAEIGPPEENGDR